MRRAVAISVGCSRRTSPKRTCLAATENDECFQCLRYCAWGCFRHTFPSPQLKPTRNDRSFRPADRPLSPLARRAARPHLRELRSAAAMVGARPRRLLAEHLGLFRSAIADAVRGRARRAQDAGRASGFRARRSTMRGRCSGMSTPAHAAGLPAIVSRGEDGELHETELAGAAAPGRGAGAAPEGAGRASPATASRPICPTSPRPSSRSSRCASLGAVWSVCAPDMAAPAVIDRFKQIEPKVLIACDGVTYAGRRHDRTDVVARAAASRCRRVEHVILHSDAAAHAAPDAAALATSIARDGRRDRRVRAGLAAVRSSALDRLFQRHHRPAEADRARPWRHHDRGAGAARPAQRHRLQLRRRTRFGERYHWYSSTGWIMWNCAGRRACSTAPPAASSTAARAAPRTSRTGPRCGASSPMRRRPSSAPARRSSPTA